MQDQSIPSRRLFSCLLCDEEGIRMKQKTKQILVAATALMIVVVGIATWNYVSQDRGEKTVTITIKADDHIIYQGDEKTNAGTLSILLKEMKEEKDIVLDYQKESFGMYIKGMGKEKLWLEDKVNNMYWTYTSSTNKQCLAAGFCDGADTLHIADQDSFLFELAKLTY